MLKKILGKWLETASKNDDQAKVNNLPKHEQARLLVERVAARNAGNRPFNPIRAAGVFLSAVNGDILSLTQRIDSYSEKLELDQGLSPQDVYSESKDVSLDQFFTDSDGMYISLAEFDVFLHSCQRLFTAIEHAMARNDRGVDYSIRLMGKCFTSIHSVCKAVEEASV